MIEGRDWWTVEVPLNSVATADATRQPRILLNPDVLAFIQDHEGVSYSFNSSARDGPLGQVRPAFYGWSITFRFIDKPTAMLFKLTYGGS